MPKPKNVQPNGGFQLPPRAYYCQDWFEREWESVFEAGWIFIGLVHELDGPGSFKTYQLGKYPIIVSMDQAGQLHALHNVCRHRGCRVVEGSGRRRSFTCPYHCWNYKLDGRLNHVPWSEHFCDFDFEKYGLHRLSVDSFWGMIFVNLDPDAAPLIDWLQGLPKNVHEKGVRPEELTLLAYREYKTGSNWKFIIENHVDCLHVPFLHSGTSDWKVNELYYGYCGPHHVSHVPYVASTPGLKPLPGLRWKYPAFATNVIFPNLITIVWQNLCAFMHIQPVDAENSIWRWFVLGVEGSNPEEYFEFYEPVVLEDIEASDMLQSSIKSPLFEVGPMAGFLEEPVAAFHNAYLQLFSLADQKTNK